MGSESRPQSRAATDMLYFVYRGLGRAAGWNLPFPGCDALYPYAARGEGQFYGRSGSRFGWLSRFGAILAAGNALGGGTPMHGSTTANNRGLALGWPSVVFFDGQGAEGGWF